MSIHYRKIPPEPPTLEMIADFYHRGIEARQYDLNESRRGLWRQDPDGCNEEKASGSPKEES